MTLYLKTCYAYVLVLVCINLLLLGVYVSSLQTVDRIHAAQDSGASSYLSNCDIARSTSDKAWLDRFCTFENAIEVEMQIQYTLLFIHSVFDVIIFFWINSREGWLGWESCERKT